MKFDTLRAIGHNFADSLASGCSELLGLHTDVVFREAAQRPSGAVVVDLLSGTVVGDREVELFPNAADVFKAALVVLCRRHHTSPTVFRRLEADFVQATLERHFTVTVQDQGGRLAVDDYHGSGARFRRLDQLGRVRRKRGVS